MAYPLRTSNPSRNRVTVRLDNDEMRVLRAMAQEQGLTVSDVLRSIAFQEIAASEEIRNGNS